MDQGPGAQRTHVMGAFDDGKQVVIDVESSLSNPFPFMPCTMVRAGIQ